jgi:transposase-like protein
VKGEIVKLVLQTINENPKDLFKALEEKGYSRLKAWSYIPRLQRWNYIKRIRRGKYTLTDKGRARLNRLVFGLCQCPYCGSTRVRLNGKRNGTGNQRYLCNNCGFGWTQGHKVQALVRALAKRKRVIFILHSNERFSLLFLQRLKEWLKSDELGYLRKDIDLAIP